MKTKIDNLPKRQHSIEIAEIRRDTRVQKHRESKKNVKNISVCKVTSRTRNSMKNTSEHKDLEVKQPSEDQVGSEYPEEETFEKTNILTTALNNGSMDFAVDIQESSDEASEQISPKRKLLETDKLTQKKQKDAKH